MKRIAELKRKRPEAFDEQDLPDISDVSQEHQADLLKNAPAYMQELLADRLKRG